jgi:hypothetical protein
VAEQIFFVTADRGFADVREHPPGTHAGVLVLHAARPSVVLLAAILDSALERMPLEQMRGCVAVADESSVRVRRPLA